MLRQSPSLLVLWFFLAFAESAGAGELTASGRVVAVTVFADRAQVTREFVIELPAGDSLVSLPGLPGELLAGSLQAAAAQSEGLRFGALEARLRHEDGLTAPRERALATEIEALKDRLSQLDDRIRTAELRLGFVSALAERLPAGALEKLAEGRLDVAALERALALVDSGATQALAERHQALIERRGVAQEIDAREREQAELASGQRATTEVRLSLAAASAGRKALRLTYQVPSAAWRPRYEARLDSASGALELLQRAEVRQSSGEDWSAVALTLSTARPSAGADMPELAPWRLGFYRPYLARELVDEAATAAPAASKADEAAPAPSPMDDFASLAAGEFSAEWQVPGRVFVPSDGSSHHVSLASSALEASLVLRATPKLEPRAYLYAKSRWSGEAPLLPGPMALIRDGAFVGETSLPLLRAGEDIRLAFGLDDRLKLDYRVVDAQPESRGLVAKRQRRERRIEIAAQNLHRRAIELELYDQLPLPTEEAIAVELLRAQPAPSERSPEGLEGLLLWRLSLTAGARAEVELLFAIEHPADQQLSGLDPYRGKPGVPDR